MSPEALRARLFWTLAPPLVLLLLGRRVLLPGVDPAAFEAQGLLGAFAGARSNLSVFAIGVTPLVTAFVLVEVVALLVPALARKRHEPSTRAKLTRAAHVLGVVLLGFQAFGIAMSLRSLADAPFGQEMPLSAPITVASLVGGSCLLVLAARVVTAQGLVSGLALFTAVDVVQSVATSLVQHVQRDAFLGVVTPAKLAFGVAVLAVPCAATWYVTRRRPVVVRMPDAGAAPYRDGATTRARAWVPVPLGSLAAYTLALNVVSFLAVLLAMGPTHGSSPLAELVDRGGVAFDVVILVQTAVCALVLARLQRRSADVTELAQRVGVEMPPDDSEATLDARKHALLLTAAFFGVLVAASHAASVAGLPVSLAALPYVTAVFVDLVDGVRLASWDVLVEERRPAALPVLRAALEARGIETRVRGSALLGVLQAFVPYAPATVVVQAADAERAKEVLEGLLRGAAVT